MVKVQQLCKYTKSKKPKYKIIHFRRMNCMVCDLYLNKTVHLFELSKCRSCLYLQERDGLPQGL